MLTPVLTCGGRLKQGDQIRKRERCRKEETPPFQDWSVVQDVHHLQSLWILSENTTHNVQYAQGYLLVQEFGFVWMVILLKKNLARTSKFT